MTHSARLRRLSTLLLAASLVLAPVARADEPVSASARRSLGAELPWTLYGGALFSAGVGAYALVVASSARQDLLVPERHPTPKTTQYLVHKVEYGTATSVVLFAAAGGLAVLAAFDTLDVVRRHSSARPSSSVAVVPLAGGAAFTVGGQF